MTTMTWKRISALACVLFALPLGANAADGNEARTQCKAKIEQVYGLRDFRKTRVEALGHHKALVQGQVKANGQYHPFECRTKYGEVSSYSYSGPHKKNDDDNNAVAVAAGVAVLAAVAIAASNDDDDNKLNTKKSVLEDMCHDMLQYRIRDEHNGSAHVTIQKSSVHGRDLKGEAKVKYNHGHPNQAKFTCHFNKQAHIIDAAYELH